MTASDLRDMQRLCQGRGLELRQPRKSDSRGGFYGRLRVLGDSTFSIDETAVYVCRAAVSSKGLSPVFFASNVCSSSSFPMLSCASKHTL